MTQPLDIRWGDRLLLVAPHPDDETLAAGGLLQRALAVRASLRVLFVSDGENNPWAQRATERRWRVGPGERERWGARRRLEALAALACLGVGECAVEFLGFPDQGLTRLLLEGDDDLVEALAAAVSGFRPTVLVAPALEDLHPDHSALAVMVRLALRRLDSRLPRPHECQYVVHHHGPLGRVAETVLALSPAEVERKRRAILCHSSQLTLRRRPLLAFAAPEERFFAARPPAENHGDHPISRAFVEDETLHLDIERSARPGAFGRTELVLAMTGHEGERRALRARLPGRPGPVDVVDPARGRLVARGLLQRAPHGERVILPAAVVAGWPQAFAKLERRFGFFDEAGWRPLPAFAPAPPSPPPARHQAPEWAAARRDG
jgi:LmbE family N-acetylglucosaminyl deacetylase